MVNTSSLRAKSKAVVAAIGQSVGIDMSYALRGGTLLASGSIASSFILFLLTLGYANFLSKDTYGNFRYIQSVAAVLVALTLTGMNTAVTQAVARGFDGTLRKAIRIQLKWSILYTLACLGIGAYYFWNGNTEFGISLFAISFLTPISLTYNTYIAFLNGKRNFRELSQYNFLSTLFVATATFGAMILTHSVIALVVTNAGANALANLFIYFRVVRTHNLNNQDDPQAISFGKHLSLMGVFATAASQIDSILVFHTLGAAELSIFSFAVAIPDRLKGFTKILSSLALPKFSIQNRSQLITGMKRRMPIFILLLSGLAALYALISPMVFNIFFPKYHDSIHLTQLYSLALVASAANVPIAALMSQRSKRELYVFTSSSSLFQIVCSILLIPPFGQIGAVVARLLSLFYNLAFSIISLTYRRI